MGSTCLSETSSRNLIFALQDKITGKIVSALEVRLTEAECEREHEGTGLGLTIAHQIIQEHDGYVEVKSELGNGSTFVVNLPAYMEESILTEKVIQQ